MNDVVTGTTSAAGRKSLDPSQGKEGWWTTNWLGFLSMFKGSPQEKQEPLTPETILTQYSNEVKKASELLDFLIVEGRPDHIADQVIDDIEDARELLVSGGHPSKENRAKLLKAYRNLVGTPRYSVTYSKIPPISFWSRDSWWPWSLLIISVIPSIVGFIFFRWYWPVLPVELRQVH